MNNYIIIRNLSSIGTAEPFGAHSAQPRGMARVPIEPEITIERLGVNAVKEASLDPTVLAVAPRVSVVPADLPLPLP